MAGFERITHVALPTSRHDTYQEGDRVEVALDDPTQWAARGCNPYFYADEINQLTKE